MAMIRRSIRGINPDAFPLELRQIPQWVAWLFGNSREAEPELTPADFQTDWSKPSYKPKLPKIPLCPHLKGGTADPKTWSRYADSTRRATWGTFEEALRYHAEHGWSCGVGFVLTPELGIVGIDLDDSLNIGSDGQLHRQEWADSVLAVLPQNAYLERSPSGRGERIFVMGEKPTPACKPPADQVGFHGLEVYDDQRFLTVTGDRPQGEQHEPARVVHADLRELWRMTGLDRAIAPRATELSAPKSWAPVVAPINDAREIERELPEGEARQLWRGEWQSLYDADRSRCDFALCRYLRNRFGPQPALIYQLLMASAMVRPKWHTRRNQLTWIQQRILKVCDSR